MTLRRADLSNPPSTRWRGQRAQRVGGGSLRHAAVLAATLFLAACGFHPLYGSTSSNPGGAEIFANIYVEPIEGDAGFELRNTLIDLIDASGRRTGQQRYALKIALLDQLQGAALQNDATITRYNYTLTASYVLTDATNANTVTSGQVSSLTAYNVVASPYATLIAQKDAQKRAGEELAERIRIDLGVYFARGVKSK
jgi:LPS-assembly lipoprotein